MIRGKNGLIFCYLYVQQSIAYDFIFFDEYNLLYGSLL